MIRLSEVAQRLDGKLMGGDCAFNALSTDTRNLHKGELFVALKGEHFDAHKFLQGAQKGGACACVVEHFDEQIALPQLVVEDSYFALGVIGRMWREGYKGAVVAITGSSGKTTVKGMLRDVFAQRGEVTATVGNFNNHVGVPLTLMQLQEQDFAVIELGTNAPGEIEYLTGLIRADVALVNNVSAAHYEGFGSIAAIAEEKGAIYQALGADKTAIINLDDPFAQTFVDRTRHLRQVGFTQSPRLDDCDMSILAADNIELNDQGCARFQLHWKGQSQQVELAVPGAHNVSNALAAAACALSASCSLTDVAQGLRGYRGDKGRMQVVAGLAGATVIDDTYNANPSSVKAAIDYLAERSGETILVLGNMGELGSMTDSAHMDLGDYAKQQGISAVFTVGDKAAFTAQAFGSNNTFSLQQALIDALAPKLHKNATVLVKGSRGARMEQVVQALISAGGQV